MTTDSQRFSTLVSRDGSTTVIELGGELDIAAQATLDEQFRRLVAANPSRVIVDLSGLSFMDASGIHALLDLRNACEQRGRALRLVRGQRNVQRLFELCDLETKFHFADSHPLERTPAPRASSPSPRSPLPPCAPQMASSQRR